MIMILSTASDLPSAKAPLKGMTFAKDKSVTRTEKIANSIPNNKFILFDNIYHEPHNDIEKDVIYKEINDFINK